MIFIGSSSVWKANQIKRLLMLFVEGVIETDKRVGPKIPFVYWFGLQNVKLHMSWREIKAKLIGVAVIAYQCP